MMGATRERGGGTFNLWTRKFYSVKRFQQDNKNRFGLVPGLHIVLTALALPLVPPRYRHVEGETNRTGETPQSQWAHCQRQASSERTDE